MMERSVHIGNRDPQYRSDGKPSRAERARIAAEVALGERNFALAGFERPSHGSGLIAVAVDGEKVLMALGRDEPDALYNLAHLASRPAGRAGGW
jgi:hypothetical protein